MSQSDNFHTVKPSDSTTLIKLAISAKTSTFLWGAPGIGKSDVIRQVANDMGYHLEDIRLSQMDPCDIRGVPYVSDKAVKIPNKYYGLTPEELTELGAVGEINTTDAMVDAVTESGDVITEKMLEWALADFLKRAEIQRKVYGKPTLFFFDEMNSAPQTIQAAAYQIVLDRRIGNYFLDERDGVVAAGNRESDKGVVYKMPSPLANRFFHIEMHVDFQDWSDWAVKTRKRPEVIGFLSAFKDKLHRFDPKKADRAFPTPRSWAKLSDLLDSPLLNESLLAETAAGMVGSGMATEFIAHRKTAHKLPKPEDVLAGRVKTLDVSETSAHFALTTSLCYELADAYESIKTASDPKKATEEFNKMSDNFFGFLMDNLSKEMVVMGIRNALNNYKISFKTKELTNWNRFFKTYGKLIAEAV